MPQKSVPCTGTNGFRLPRQTVVAELEDVAPRGDAPRAGATRRIPAQPLSAETTVKPAGKAPGSQTRAQPKLGRSLSCFRRLSPKPGYLGILETVDSAASLIRSPHGAASTRRARRMDSHRCAVPFPYRVPCTLARLASYSGSTDKLVPAVTDLPVTALAGGQKFLKLQQPLTLPSAERPWHPCHEV